MADDVHSITAPAVDLLTAEQAEVAHGWLADFIRQLETAKDSNAAAARWLAHWLQIPRHILKDYVESAVVSEMVADIDAGLRRLLDE